MSNIREKVIEFHKEFGQPILDKPQVPSDDRVRFRMKLLAHEFFEFLESMSDDMGYLPEAKRLIEHFIKHCTIDVDLANAMRESIDIDYVVEGTRLEFGVDGYGVLERVHAANMAKSKWGRDAEGKPMKPAGWKPPDIEAELICQGATVLPE